MISFLFSLAIELQLKWHFSSHKNGWRVSKLHMHPMSSQCTTSTHSCERRKRYLCQGTLVAKQYNCFSLWHETYSKLPHTFLTRRYLMRLLSHNTWDPNMLWEGSLMRPSYKIKFWGRADKILLLPWAMLH